MTNLINNVEELQPGKTVVFRGVYYGEKQPTPYSNEITVVELPYQNEKDQWLVSMQYTANKHPFTSYLSDLGVVPNRNGLWAPDNWLEDPSKVPAPQK